MDPSSETLEPTITQQPLVSILMLTYNRAHFIKEAIESVIAQTYSNWELIIIDDGSTDDTAAIIAGLHESRIRYIRHKENAGLHARRKESLHYPKGEYIAILDSDDFWLDETKLQAQVDWLQTQLDCVLVGTFSKLVDKDGRGVGSVSYATGDLSIRNKILYRNQFTHSAVMMRKDALQRTKGYRPILAEDMELFLQLGKFGTFANISKPMTAHRVHNNSMNDHGILMCRAVHKIITRHSDYPNYKKAKLLSYIRLLYCYVIILVRKALPRRDS